jgi:hypothetical protein
MARTDRIKELIEKYHNGALTEIEKQELDAWIASRESNRILFEQLTNNNLLFNELKKVYEFDKEKGWQNLLNKIQTANTKKSSPLKKGNKK